MGIYDRQYYQDQSDGGFLSASGLNTKSMVVILIGINVAVFILDAIFFGRLNDVFQIYSTDATQPWFWFRFLTYGFAHATPGHLLGNMIGLFFFGRVAETHYGPKKFLWMYLTAILAGSIVWMLVASVTGGQGALLGASGGVVAIIILFCINFPHQKVSLLFLPMVGIPAWVLGVVIVGGDLLGVLSRAKEGNESQVAFTVHLVGAAYAWFFYKTRWELSKIIPDSASGGVTNLGNLFKSRPKLKVHRPSQDEVRHEKLAEKADVVLEKLHQQGEQSLTARERRILEDYSRSIKQKR